MAYTEGPATTPEAPERTGNRNAWKSGWESVRSVASILAIAWLFTSFVAQATVVPSESMEPTVLVGDHFFIDKVGFPANLPETVREWLPDRDIERGDIIALWSPEDPGLRLVKRVIGLPGETVELRGTDIYIDDRRLDEPYVMHSLPPALHRESGFGPVEIPDDSFFMMGDNRDNSRDSRYWGFASRDNMIGRALFVYWSFQSEPYDPLRWTLLDRVAHYGSVALHFLTRTRWARTGTVL